jgi:membrane fusion protein, multidrug efflux system
MTSSSPSPRATKWIPLVIVAIAVVALAFVVWRLDHAPETDDAYVYADSINVVPEVSGRIVDLPVSDNQLVRQGDLLLRIDPRPYEDALAQARAQLVTLDSQIMLTQRSVNAQKFQASAAKATVERARAAAKQAQDTLERLAPLEASGYAAAEDVDRARTARRSTEAELNAALLQAEQAAAAVSGVDALVAQRAVVAAQIAIAELHLEWTVVRAPFDGRVVALKTTVGQYASAQKPIFTLVDARRWYVVANFRETELKRIYPGAPCTVHVMSNASRRFRGAVDSIGYGVLPGDGGLVMEGLPRVERSINWVHVSQRFPVKIRVEQPDPDLFRVGASAIAVVHRGDPDRRTN